MILFITWRVFPDSETQRTPLKAARGEDQGQQPTGAASKASVGRSEKHCLTTEQVKDKKNSSMVRYTLQLQTSVRFKVIQGSAWFRGEWIKNDAEGDWIFLSDEVQLSLAEYFRQSEAGGYSKRWYRDHLYFQVCLNLSPAVMWMYCTYC